MRRDIRAELTGKIPEDKIPLVVRSFDVIGSKGKAVAIIEVPDEVSKYKSEIGMALMRVQRNVKSVLLKASERTGDYRTRAMTVIAGDLDTEVIHKESGCRFKLDPKKVYFSPRESHERERIIGDVNAGEKVLVMFSGIAPIPICIARFHKDVICTAVELNPYAHEYAVENVRLNKVSDRVTPIQGDVREVCQGMSTFDRVYMPLPKGAYKFLDVASPLVKDGGTLGLYHWAPEDDLWTEAEQLLHDVFSKEGRSIEVIHRVKVSQYNPKYWKVRLDVKIQ